MKWFIDIFDMATTSFGLILYIPSIIASVAALSAFVSIYLKTDALLLFGAIVALCAILAVLTYPREKQRDEARWVRFVSHLIKLRTGYFRYCPKSELPKYRDMLESAYGLTVAMDNKPMQKYVLRLITESKRRSPQPHPVEMTKEDRRFFKGVISEVTMSS